jgi:hypothetical protein
MITLVLEEPAASIFRTEITSVGQNTCPEKGCILNGGGEWKSNEGWVREKGKFEIRGQEVKHIIFLSDCRPPPWCKWAFRPSEMLPSINSYLVTDVSGRPLGCPKMSATNYQSALHTIPEGWRSHTICLFSPLLHRRKNSKFVRRHATMHPNIHRLKNTKPVTCVTSLNPPNISKHTTTLRLSRKLPVDSLMDTAVLQSWLSGWM